MSERSKKCGAERPIVLDILNRCPFSALPISGCEILGELFNSSLRFYLFFFFHNEIKNIYLAYFNDLSMYHMSVYINIVNALLVVSNASLVSPSLKDWGHP